MGLGVMGLLLLGIVVDCLVVVGCLLLGCWWQRNRLRGLVWLMVVVEVIVVQRIVRVVVWSIGMR